MKVSTISYMERKNCGNYEHQEFTVTAVLNDGDVVDTCLSQLKALTHKALYTDSIAQEFPVKSESTAAELAKAVEVVEAPKKAPAKKAPVKAEEKKEPAKVVEAEVVKEVKSTAVKYSNTDKHPTKAALAGYLAKTYGEAWKKKEGLKEFSATLNGVDMMDDKGQILDSFKAVVSNFFGESENGVL